jgi:hypothetical protein
MRHVDSQLGKYCQYIWRSCEHGTPTLLGIGIKTSTVKAIFNEFYSSRPSKAVGRGDKRVYLLLLEGFIES